MYSPRKQAFQPFQKYFENFEGDLTGLQFPGGVARPAALTVPLAFIGLNDSSVSRRGSLRAHSPVHSHGLLPA